EPAQIGHALVEIHDDRLAGPDGYLSDLIDAKRRQVTAVPLLEAPRAHHLGDPDDLALELLRRQLELVAAFGRQRLAPEPEDVRGELRRLGRGALQGRSDFAAL